MNILKRFGAITRGGAAGALPFRPPKAFDLGPAPRALKIALVSSRSPMPMRRGDQLTVAHLISFLSSRGHTVDLYTLATGGEISDKDRAWLQAHCRHVHLIQHEFWDVFTSLFRGVLSGLPLQCLLFQNRKLERAISHGLAMESYDVGYVYYVRSAETFLRSLKGRHVKKPKATYLALQLSQTLNVKRILTLHQLSLIERLIYRIEISRIARYEARVWREFSRTVLIGNRDLEAIQDTCRSRGWPPIGNHVLIPHGVDTEKLKPQPEVAESANCVMFLGGMETNINVAAVIWFFENVWPLVRQKYPAARFEIVGRAPRPEVYALDGREGVVVVGEVPDVGAALARATICVNPIQAGAGMQNKLLEYLSCGKAAVASPIANEGIGAEPGEDLVIAKAPREFADAVSRLLGDPVERTRLGMNGRQFVLKRWTWAGLFLELEADMTRILPAAEGVPRNADLSGAVSV